MASNNFFLNNDPLLYQSPFNHNNDAEELYKQYKLLQQQNNNNPIQLHDYLGELDKLIKGIDNTTMENLNNNKEYKRLSDDLNSLIQNELLANIKWKVNGNSNAIKNMERQMEIINEANKSIEEEKRKNLNELNDYVKNYSNITFDEYKKIKNKEYESN